MIESLIYKVEKDNDYYQIRTSQDSEMIKTWKKNYRILRRVHHEVYSTIAENFQLYINSLEESELDETDADFVSSGLASIKNVDKKCATELLMLFDFFYFINGPFPTATAHMFIPSPDLPFEVNGEEISIKKLYGKFRGTNSHALVSSQFLGTLNIFFGGQTEITQRFLTETYQNLTVSTLSTDGSFVFEALIDISAEINILLRGLSRQNTEIKKEDEDLDFKLDEETPQDDPIINEDDLNVEPENVDEKAKRFEPVVDPTLETPEQVEISDQDKLREQEWLDDFLRRITPPTEQEENDRTIVQVLTKEMDQSDDINIEDIFIDDNEAFYNDDMTENHKENIKSLIDKTNFYNNDGVAYNDDGESDQDIEFQVDDRNVAADSNNDSNDENIDNLVYVKYVPPPLHPRQRLEERVKKVRKRKERYRTLTKKKAIKFLNKRNAKELLKEHKKKLKAERVNDEIMNEYLSDETIGFPVGVVKSDNETVQYAESVREDQNLQIYIG